MSAIHSNRPHDQEPPNMKFSRSLQQRQSFIFVRWSLDLPFWPFNGLLFHDFLFDFLFHHLPRRRGTASKRAINSFFVPSVSRPASSHNATSSSLVALLKSVAMMIRFPTRFIKVLNPITYHGGTWKTICQQHLTTDWLMVFPHGSWRGLVGCWSGVWLELPKVFLVCFQPPSPTSS